MLIQELIDTLWNVNYNTASKETIGMIELIDTLWNVNRMIRVRNPETGRRINRYIMECKLFIYIILYSFICELIDTLWNVNRYKGKSSSIVDGINRYIMECKSKTVLRTLRATW